MDISQKIDIALSPHERKSRGQLTLISLAILALSLFAALSGWLYTWYSVREYTKTEFQHETEEAQILTKKRLEIYIGALYGLKGFFAGSRSVERDEWAAYVRAVDVKGRYPGVSVISFAERVMKKDRAAFTRSVRKDTALSPEGLPDFTIYPAEDRPEYFPVTYIEPRENDNKLLGFDMSSGPMHRAAIEQARDSGLPAATGRIALAGDISRGPAFVIFLPIYENGLPVSTVEERRKALKGVVAVAFRTQDLLSGIFSAKSVSPKIDLKIFDGKQLGQEHLLYDENPGSPGPNRKVKGSISRLATLDFAGQTWTLFFRAQPGFGSTPGRQFLPFFVLAGGLVFSCLFSGTFYTLATSRHRAMEFAMRMTKDLRHEVGERTRAEETVRKSLKHLVDQQTALVALTHRATFGAENVLELTRKITEIAAETLGVERVSIWRYTKDRSAITCEDLYELSKKRHSAGLQLAAKSYPRYFAALEKMDIVAADGAQEDVRTSEFSKAYLGPLGITSMMDAPIRLFNTLAGVLCHEHVGPPRHWTPDEQLFAISVGNLISLLLEQEERKRTEEALRKSEEKWRSLVTNAPDFIVTVDRSGTLLTVNRTYPTLPLEAVIGKSVYEFIPSEYREMGQQAIEKVFRTGRSGQYEIPGRGPEPDIMVWYDARVGPILHGKEVTGVIIIATDITESKAAEAALLKQKEELVRLDAEKEQLEFFAYVASHDLQEPLQKIIAFGDLLEAQCRETLDPKGKDYVERMQKAAIRMSQLVDDLLRFSRVKKKGDPLETVDLNDVLFGAMQDLEVRIRETKGRVDYTKLATIKADRLEMHQLFQNLISNGLKFCRKEEPPRVLVRSRHLEDGSVEIAFEDNGIGFNEKYLDRIFKPFERLHGRGEYEGSGIGLAICQKIVRDHGGAITAKSVLGKGSIFIVTLPSGDPKRS